MDWQFVTSRKGIRVFRKRHLCARSWKKGAGGVGKETLYAHEIRNVFPGKTLHNICHSTKTKEQSGNLPYPVFLNSIPWPHSPTRCEAWWGQGPQLSWYPNVEKGLTNLNLFNNSKKLIYSTKIYWVPTVCEALFWGPLNEYKNFSHGVYLLVGKKD